MPWIKPKDTDEFRIKRGEIEITVTPELSFPLVITYEGREFVMSYDDATELTVMLKEILNVYDGE